MYELALIFAVLALLGIIFLLTGLFSLGRLFKAGSQPAHYLPNRLAMLFLIAGFIILGHFWLVGGPTQGGAASSLNGYLEPYAAAALIGLGIIIAFVIYPPHRKTAAQKAQLRTKRASWPWPRRHKWLSALILIVVAIGLSFAYQAYARYSNHKSFEQVREDIDLIYSDVVKQVGPPYTQKRESSCSRRYQEFAGYTDTSCFVSTEFIYGVNDISQATLKYKEIQSIIKSQNNLIPQEQLSTHIKGEAIVNDYYQSAFDSYKTKRGMKCIAKYVYDTPQDSFLASPVGTKGLYVVLECDDGAKVAWYPLEN